MSLLVLLLLVTAAPAPKRKPDGGSLSLAAATMRSPVFIDADKMEAADKSGKVILKQNVKVRRQTMTITCDRMIAHYVQVGAQQEVHRVECDGNVKMVDRDRTARGEHADFDNTRGLLQITGNPELSHASSAFVRGDKVLYDTNKDLFWMEGRVRGVVEGGSQLEKDKKK
ncbi:MAG: LptA/OstA family protein [Myxococcaceae bacterium]